MLQWPQVDVRRGIIRIEPGDAKDDEPRIVVLKGEALQALREHWEWHMRENPLCPWVFNREGKRIQDFEKAWATACRKAEVEGRIFHDFRRTAVRDMTRAGVPEAVAMKISGHKTRSVFDRYNIVNEDDLARAAEQISDYQEQNIHNSFTMDDLEEETTPLND